MAKKGKQDGDNRTNRTSPLSDDQEALLKALFDSRGIVTEACRKTGNSRDTHYRWMKENEAYAEAYASIEDSAIDFVEGMMFERIEDGSDGLIKFYLATKGKKRGYIERTEVEHSGKVESSITELTNEQLDALINAGISGKG